MSDVDLVKSKTNIVDIVGNYVRLTPAGSNFRGLCPFHNEKTPSFMVNEERQIFHCFGCNKGGDVLTFVQEIEGLNFPEALKLLADKAGLTLEGFNPKEMKQKNRLRELMQETVLFFQENLAAEKGQIARDYLADRQVTEALIEKFQLGFIPEGWDNLVNFLSSRGYSNQEMAEAGLVIQSEKNSSRYYDRFRARIMFPIFNAMGDPIAFSGRVLPGDDSGGGKYINSPQTRLYDKSRALYGLNLAKSAIKQKNQAIFLEGNLDVVMSHAAGVDNVVAACGTAVTEEQLKVVGRYSNNLNFAFDADSAGLAAAEKAMDLALTLNLNVSAIDLRQAEGEAKDVADIVKVSKAEWQELSKKTKPAMDYYFENIFATCDLTNSREKKEAAEKFLKKIAVFASKIEQSHYLDQLADKTGVKAEVLYDLLNEELREQELARQKTAARGQFSQDQKKESSIEQGVGAGAGRAGAGAGEAEVCERLLNRIAAVLMFYPSALDKSSQDKLKEILKNQPDTAIVKIIKIVMENGVKFSNPNQYLKIIKDEDLKTKAARLLMIAENHFNDYNGENKIKFSPEADLQFCLIKLDDFSKKNNLQTLAGKIRKAEQDKNVKELKELLGQYNEALKKSRKKSRF